MRTVRFILFAVLVLVLQRALFDRFALFGVHLDLLLLFALCAGITGGPDRGAAVGFGAGLAADVFLLGPVGLSALAYTAGAYLVGSLSDDAHDLPWVTVGLAMLGSATALVVFLTVGRIGGDVHASLGRVVHVVSVVAMTNGVAAPFLVRFVRRLWMPTRVPAW